MAFLKLLVKNHPIAVAAATTVTVASMSLGGAYRHYKTPSGSDIIKRLENVNINGVGKRTVSIFNAHTGWVSYSCSDNPVYVPPIIGDCWKCHPIKYGQYLCSVYDSPTNVKVEDNIVQVVKTYELTEEEYSGGISTYTINSNEDLDTLIGCVTIFAAAGCQMN
jgi:hypothetical protein